jgi:hypothetical protein
MLTFDALFAWADLHANRFRTRSFAGLLDWYPRYFDRQGFRIPNEPGDDMAQILVARDDLPDGSGTRAR